MGQRPFHRAASFMRRKLGIPAPLVQVQLLDKEVVVREGTIRFPPDYDDAWMLACALYSEIMFDIGANIGYDSLLALAGGGVQKLVAVEPNPIALSTAAEILIHNGLSDRVRFVPAFASDVADSVVEFWTIGDGAAGSIYRGHARSASRTKSFITVPTTTLDTLMERYNEVPDFVKIDVEGAEHKVLQGSRRCAGLGTTRFLVEMHSPPELPMNENAACVLEWCRSVGYSAWYLKQHSLLTDPQAIAKRGRCHLLLQPAAWPYPEWLRGIEQSASLDCALASARKHSSVP